MPTTNKEDLRQKLVNSVMEKLRKTDGLGEASIAAAYGSLNFALGELKNQPDTLHKEFVALLNQVLSSASGTIQEDGYIEQLSKRVSDLLDKGIKTTEVEPLVESVMTKLKNIEGVKPDRVAAASGILAGRVISLKSHPHKVYLKFVALLTQVINDSPEHTQKEGYVGSFLGKVNGLFDGKAESKVSTTTATATTTGNN